MKELYHICWTAHSEVLLRNIDDVRIMTNFSALAALRTGTEVLVSSDMSTHSHRIVLSENPREFVHSFILSATKAFNHLHGRCGDLFDEGTFILPLHGPRHIQMAMNYVLRQGLHHGASEMAFSYPWSSCNCLFRKDRGLDDELWTNWSEYELQGFISRRACVPEGWKADRNGILLRSSFEEREKAENWYGTARNFTFSMIRKTSQEWLDEQEKDMNGEKQISLGVLEKGYTEKEINSMIAMETNSRFSSRKQPDMDLCSIIDNEMIGRFGKKSVYQLDAFQKRKLADELRYELGVNSEGQISRCLALRYFR